MQPKCSKNKSHYVWEVTDSSVLVDDGSFSGSETVLLFLSFI